MQEFVEHGFSELLVVVVGKEFLVRLGIPVVGGDGEGCSGDGREDEFEKGVGRGLVGMVESRELGVNAVRNICEEGLNTRWRDAGRHRLVGKEAEDFDEGRPGAGATCGGGRSSWVLASVASVIGGAAVRGLRWDFVDRRVGVQRRRRGVRSDVGEERWGDEARTRERHESGAADGVGSKDGVDVGGGHVARVMRVVCAG